MSRRLVALLAASVVALGFGVYAFVIEPSSLVRRDVTLELPRWPAACADLRVAVLADLHAGAPYFGLEKVDTVVQAVLDAKPDLILLAGDYVIQGVLGGTPIEPETIAQHLEPLTKAALTFAVLGNHDHWLDPVRVTRALADRGIVVLADTRETFTKAACSLTIVGVADFLEGKPNVAQAFADAAEPILALTHNPDVFPQIPKHAALTIAGHTHGGQVALPLVGRPIIPSEFGERYALGAIVEDGKHLFVSSGLGTSIMPVRFRVVPEIVVLTLR